MSDKFQKIKIVREPILSSYIRSSSKELFTKRRKFVGQLMTSNFGDTTYIILAQREDFVIPEIREIPHSTIFTKEGIAIVIPIMKVQDKARNESILKGIVTL